jgi:hypothetical protein
VPRRLHDLGVAFITGSAHAALLSQPDCTGSEGGAMIAIPADDRCDP